MAILELGDRSVAVEEEIVLGRARDCGLAIPDKAASRQHARVLWDGDNLCIEDLGSNNGTLVNGHRVEGRVRLQDGDRIGIGTHEVRVRMAGSSAARPAIDPEALVGRTIGSYRIDRLLARGPTGDVYRAQQLNLNRAVAFKVIAQALHRGDPARIAAFLRDAGAAGSVRDERVVQIHECGHDDGLLWYSMELVAGDNFDQILAREGAIDPTLALLVGERAAQALGAVHAKGVFHRDLRPAVLLLTPEGTVKVCDAGLADAFGRGAALVRRGLSPTVPASSAWYLSPEQLRGEPGDARSDVYGLGCVLFHLLAGRPPFAGANARAVAHAHLHEEVPSVREAVPEIPEQFERLLGEMLAKRPDWRHADCAEVAATLGKLREELSRSASPKLDAAARAARARAAAQRAQARAEARAKGRLLRWTLAATLMAALAGAAGWLFLRTDAAAPPPRPMASSGGGHAPGEMTGGPQAARPPAPIPVAAGAGAQPPRPDRTVADPAADALAEANRLAAAGEWGAAAAVLRQAAIAHPGERRRLDLQIAALEDRGRAWYRGEVAALPAGASAAQLAARLPRLARLRDQALDADRADAESRYQTELARLTQRLGEARRAARTAIEARRTADLPAIADALAEAFAGTPVEGLHRQFAAACREAARPPAGAATATAGEAVLARAAGMQLAGDGIAARALLLGAGGLDSPELVRRRELLLGRAAAILAFDDPADLQALDAVIGRIRLERGALTGPAGEAAVVACMVAVGGAAWDIGLIGDFAAAGEACQAALTVEHGGEVPVQVGWDQAAVSVRIQTASGVQSWTSPRPSGPLRIRLTARDGRIAAEVGGQRIAQAAAAVPAGAQTRLAVAGMDWRLDDWQVLGER